MWRRIFLTAAVVVNLVGWSPATLAWDESALRLIVDKSIDALPKPIKKFYENRKRLILEKLLDPVRAGQRLVFEMDRLESFPFEGIPEDRQSAVAKYGEDKIEEAGDLPWKLVETYEKLVEAFRNQDIPTVEPLSVEIAFMVGRLHNPVNVSQYGDGEPIDQAGLRERLEERLLEIYGDKLKFDTPAAIYLDRPAEYALSIPRSAYVWVDNILLNDYIAHMGVMSYDRFYYEGLWQRSSLILNQTLHDMCRDISSYWYTAWVKAGKPELPKK